MTKAIKDGENIEGVIGIIYEMDFLRKLVDSS